MTSPAPKAAVRQFLVSVSGIDGYFPTKSGGNTSADVERVYDGGSLDPDLIAGNPEVEDVTLGRHFAPARDGSILNRLRSRVGRYTATVTIQPTDSDLSPAGPATVHPGALLVGITEPEVDAGSGDPAMYELTFAIPRAAR